MHSYNIQNVYNFKQDTNFGFAYEVKYYLTVTLHCVEQKPPNSSKKPHYDGTANISFVKKTVRQ